MATRACIAAGARLSCALLALALGAAAPALAARSRSHKPRSAPRAPRCVPVALNGSSVLRGAGLSVSPLPGSYDATPHTQISLLGASPHALGGLRVSGSRSGPHRGRLARYSQGDGASFVPARPFAAGEIVTVRGRVRTPGGARAFSYRFAVAHDERIGFTLNPPSGRDPHEAQHFRSRPDLEPPTLALSARSPETAPGDIFVSPNSGPHAPGPMIFDEAGNLVWFEPLPAGIEAEDLRVQQLGARPVLTWWQGHVPIQGFGEGEDVIADSSYRQIGHVRAGNGLTADLHEFRITPSVTALLTFFDPLACDLAAIGGPAAGWVNDSGFQEIDLRTGLVRREWHALDHVALADSYNSQRPASNVWPFDFFHVNSLDPGAGGTLLLSARNTWALYELSAGTGQVLERIGGKRSDVPIGRGAGTAFQHDATTLANGTISLFDNGAEPRVHPQSRGLILALGSGRATVVAQYVHPHPLSAASEGSVQVLENGDVFVGWGAQPYFSEFSASGRLLFDGHLSGSYQSYRAYRYAWTGAPAGRPSLAALAPKRGGPVTVYASFNGDTRTAGWRVFAGSSPYRLALVASAPRSGFETAIPTPQRYRYAAVQAVDAAGRVLASSGAVASRPE